MIESILEWFYNALTYIFDWLFDQIGEVFSGIYTFLDSVPVYVYQAISGVLNLVGFDFSFDFAGQLYGAVSYVIPLNALITIMLGNLAIVVSIRTVRWGLAAIPTIGG